MKKGTNQMKTPEIIRTLQGLVTWRGEVEQTLSSLQNQIIFVKKVLDNLTGSAPVENTIDGATVDPKQLEGKPSEVVEAAVKLADLDTIPALWPKLANPNSPAPLTSEDDPRYKDVPAEPAPPADAIARQFDQLLHPASVVPRGSGHRAQHKKILTPSEAARLAADLEIGLSDVTEVEAAVLNHLADGMAPAIVQLQKLARHPDVDSQTCDELNRFIVFWSDTLGIQMGEGNG